MNVYKIVKRPFFQRYMVPWRSPLTSSQQRLWTQFQVRSQSGGKIKCLVSKTTSENPKGTVVLGHPMSREAKGYFLKNGYTDFLNENGYNVFLFDFNGFGESTHGNFS